LLVKPRISVLSSGLTSVYVEKAKDTDPDWEFFALWEEHDPLWEVGHRFAATSKDFAAPGRFRRRCHPVQYGGEIILERGYITDLGYAIDDKADLREFDELRYMGESEWLVEPLALPALRKWLLVDMQDDNGDSVNVAWPRSFWSWFKDNKHPRET